MSRSIHQKRRAICAYDYKASENDELTISQGEHLVIEAEDEDGWVLGFVESRPKVKGLFPLNYVTLDKKVEEIETQAKAAEETIVAERSAVDACQKASAATLSTLEKYLKRTLGPNHVHIEMVAPGKELPKSPGEKFAIKLSAKVKKRLTGGRRELNWEALCACLDECLLEESTSTRNLSKSKEESPPRTPIAMPKKLPTRNDVARMRQEVNKLDEDFELVPDQREHKRRREESLSKIFTLYDQRLRNLFSGYAKDNKDTDLRGLVSPADFLRCCKDTNICTALLSRQEVTTIYRLCMTALSSPQQTRSLRLHAPVGLNEEQFTKALARCAVAAYSHLPAMSKAEKLEAMFAHMCLKPDFKTPQIDDIDQSSHFSDNQDDPILITAAPPPPVQRSQRTIPPGQPAPIYHHQQAGPTPQYDQISSPPQNGAAPRPHQSHPQQHEQPPSWYLPPLQQQQQQQPPVSNGMISEITHDRNAAHRHHHHRAIASPPHSSRHR